jgi:hypothetical protein
MSVLGSPPPPPGMVALSACRADEPFLYVRQIRVAPVGFKLLLLNNGRAQILAQSYDLRWIDARRIFMVRSNGDCEAIDLARFVHRDALQALLHGDAIDDCGLSPDLTLTNSIRSGVNTIYTS